MMISFLILKMIISLIIIDLAYRRQMPSHWLFFFNISYFLSNVFLGHTCTIVGADQCILCCKEERIMISEMQR